MADETEIIYACGQAFLPEELAQEAVENALQENPENSSASPDLAFPSAGTYVPEETAETPEAPVATAAPDGEAEEEPEPMIISDGIEPPVKKPMQSLVNELQLKSIDVIRI